MRRRNIFRLALAVMMMAAGAFLPAAVAGDEAPRIKSAAELERWLVGTKWHNAKNEATRVFKKKVVTRGDKSPLPYKAKDARRLKVGNRNPLTFTFDEDYRGFTSSWEKRRFVFAGRVEPEADSPPKKEKSKSKPSADEPGRVKGGGGSLQRLEPPATVEPAQVRGSGKDRKAELIVENTGSLDIQRIKVQLFYLDRSGRVVKSSPKEHAMMTERSLVGPGESFEMVASAMFMTKDTVSVDGIATMITYSDGTKWPTWTGAAPAREQAAPVTVKMLGRLGEGDRSVPVVGAFSHSAKPVTGVIFALEYLDADGRKLGSTGGGYSSRKPILTSGKRYVMCQGKGPPEGAVDVDARPTRVTFLDGSVWTPKK